MPKIDLTITITMIIALVAIVSPIFTTIINNLFLLKMKKLEIEQQHYENTVLHKRNILEKYIMYLSACTANPTPENLEKFSEYHSLAYMYMPLTTQETMSKVYNLANEHNWNEIINYIDTLSTDAYSTIKTLKL